MDALDEIPVAGVSETGDVPESRIKDAETLRTVFNRLKEADEGSSKNRAVIQAMFDGAPPYDQGELDRSGQGGRTNVNFGEAEAQLEFAMAGYIDLMQSVDSLVTVSTGYGETSERPEINEILAEELSRTIRQWPQYNFNTLHLCHHFVAHGVGIGYFPDSTDWRFKGTGLGEFYVPRQTFASEDDLEIATARRSYPTWHLYRKIANEEVATALGWNVPAVKKALAKAASKSVSDTSYEELQAEMKNNDFGCSASHKEVLTVHAWIREFDNTITHYIITENDDCGNEFLYEKRNAFPTMQQAFVLFPYGLGTNAKTHGIRGLGHKIYSQISVSNRLLSQAVDSGMLSSAMVIQPNDEEVNSELALAYLGNLAIVNPNVEIKDAHAPNLSQAVIPILSEMERRLNARVGQYSTQNIFSGGERKTRFEVAAQLEQAARLSNTALDIFYGPFERLIREVVRRLSRENYLTSEPGGREAADLRLRLIKRGVPAEALYKLDHGATKAVRAIGAGSPAARSLALAQLTDYAPAYDDVGRHNLLRDRTIAAVGVAQADRYIPKKLGSRPPDDAKTAQLENHILITGGDVDVLTTELHAVHAEIHLEQLNRMNEDINKGIVPMAEGVPVMLPLYDHTAVHVDQISGDPIIVERAALYRQNLQQLSETIDNGLREIEAAQRKAAEEQAAGGQPGAAPAGPDLKLLARYEEHKAKLAMAKEKHDQEMMFRLQKASLERSLEDARNASQIRRLLPS